MKFGLFYLPAFDADVHKDASTLYSQIIEQTILGEQLGFESVWVSEHHFSPYGGDIPNPPLLMMALAQHTRTMRLVSAGVAADTVAGKERLSTKEGVTSALE